MRRIVILPALALVVACSDLPPSPTPENLVQGLQRTHAEWAAEERARRRAAEPNRIDLAGEADLYLTVNAVTDPECRRLDSGRAFTCSMTVVARMPRFGLVERRLEAQFVRDGQGWKALNPKFPMLRTQLSTRLP